MKSFRYIVPVILAGAVAFVTHAQSAAATVQTPVASVTATATPSGLAFGVNQVLKLQQGGLGKDVLINYVNGANLSFALRADDIVYLHQVGVPEEVITAMMDKERNHVTVAQTDVTSQSQQVRTSTQVNPPTPQVSSPTTTVVTQPPVVYSSPSYVYSYPAPYYSGYPYYGGYGYGWGSPLSLSFGFGWGGHSHGGWGGGYHGGGGWHGGGGHHH